MKCRICSKVMKKTMYSHNWLMNWYKCKYCGKEYKIGYTKVECDKLGIQSFNGNNWYPNLIELKSEV